VLESVVEDHLAKRCEELGLECLKFTSPSRRAVPDRLVIGFDATGHPLQVFVELKRPGEIPRPDQRAMIARLRDHGAHALVIDSVEGVEAFLADYVLEPDLPLCRRDPHQAPLPGHRGGVLSL